MIGKLHLSRYGIPALGVLMLPPVYFISRYSYNLFHSLADGLTIVIAACAFVVVWNSRRNVDNNYFTYVGISLLFFAFLDLVHMLGNKNMGVFPGYGNLGPTFYIASRYLLSISLVIAPLFINRRLNTAPVLAAYSLATCLILLSVFRWNVFPACFVEGVGLTPFKVISDYAVCLILLAAMGLVLINRRSFDSRVLRTLVFSLVLSIATGLTFTLYTDPFGLTNLVGHIFQIGSFYLIYASVIETSLAKPQDILFRKLKQNEERLAQINAELQQEMTEREQAEKALHDSEEKYRSLFENLGSALLLTEPVLDGDGRLVDFRCLMANPSVEKQLGKTPDEMVGKSYSEVWHTGRDPVFDICEEVLSSGEPFKAELLLPATGRYFDMAVYRPTAGRLALLLSDITDRKQAEQSLREARAAAERRAEELRAMMDTVPAIVFIADDPECRQMTGNQATHDLLGVPLHGNVSKSAPGGERPVNFSAMKDGHEVPADELPVQQAAKGRDVRDYELDLVFDGARRTIFGNATPLRSSDGAVTGAVGAFIDITSRKEAEEKIRQARDELELRVRERTAELAKAGEKVMAERQRLLSVLETLPVVITLLRPDHHVEWVNKAYRDALGDNVGLLCYASQFGRDKPCEECQAFLPLKTGRPHNWEWTLPDGRTFDIYNFPFADIDGSPMVLEMDLDITEQRRAEEEKAGLEAQLRQAQKLEALGTLSGGIAHDFNNILAIVIGFAEVAKGRVAGNRGAEEALKRIFEAGIRGRDIVRQMLTFSRKTEQEKKPLILSGIVKESIKLLRASIPSTISIKVDVKSESGLVMADLTQIQQVLMNICANGAHAMMEKGGVLEVTLSDFSMSGGDGELDEIKPGLYMKLTVSDTGAGIPPENMDKIFDPFFTTKKVGEGTGLGLSVVHGIVKQHDGYIRVESEPGKGSTFSVYLPKFTEPYFEDRTVDDAVPTGHERVLFIDDEEPLAEMGEDILSDLGYKVTAKTSSKEALALLKADPARFDLVVTDQTMPDMTGIELAREALALRPDMRIIMATGFSHLVDADTAKRAGIKAFVMKPLTKREISRTLRKVLDEPA